MTHRFVPGAAGDRRTGPDRGVAVDLPTGPEGGKQAGAHGARTKGPSAVMIIPALAFFIFFAIVPLFAVVVLSLTEWDGLTDPVFTGLTKWRETLTDSRTHNAMRLSLFVMVATWLIQAPTSLMIGVFIAGRQKYRNFLAVLYFLPLVFSAAAVAIAFKSLLDPNFGFAQAMGLDFLVQDWLGKPSLAMGVVLFVIAWIFIPFHSLLYQAGVRQIPQSLYEAAMIDGASPLRRFWSITIPQLRYTIITSSTLMLVGSLTYFDLIYVMTAGGPGDATRILPVDMYLVGFRAFDMGRASVIAVILVVVGLVLSITLNRVSGATRMESQMEGM